MNPRHAASLAAIAAAVVAAYATSFDAGFVLDNRLLVLENPAIREASVANVGYLLTHDYWQPWSVDGLYRPLTTLSYLFNYAVLGNGARPLGYHAVNLLLHLACVGAVYALAWRATGRPWPTRVAAALFGLHPIATEAVTNVVGRADLLAALGVLGGALCHARSARAGRWLAGLAAASATAFFSKESGLVLLPVLLLVDLVDPARSGGADAAMRLRAAIAARWRSYAIALAVLIAYLAARSYAAANGPPAEAVLPIDNPLVEGGFWASRLTALAALGLGLWKLLLPIHLSADYSYAAIRLVAWPPASSFDLAAIAAAATFVAAVAALLLAARRDRALLFFAGLWLIALLPAANLVVLIGTVLAERTLYLPLAGFAGAIALLAERAAGGATAAAAPPAHRRRGVAAAVAPATRRRAWATGAVAITLVALGLRTAVRNRDWTSELALWTAALRVVPESAKAQKGYAQALYAADPRRLDEVVAAAERAVAIRPDYGGALVDLGSYYVAQGDAIAAGGADAVGAARARYREAVAVLDRATALEQAAEHRFRERMRARGVADDAIPPYGDPVLQQNRAVALVRAGRFDEALAAYARLRLLRPDDASLAVDESAVLAWLGRWDDAIAALWQAVEIAPGHPDAMARLAEMYRRRDPATAAVAVDGAGATRLRRDDPSVLRDRCRALRGLAATYASARDARAPSAAAAAARACGEAGPMSPPPPSR